VSEKKKENNLVKQSRVIREQHPAPPEPWQTILGDTKIMLGSLLPCMVVCEPMEQLPRGVRPTQDRESLN